MAESKKPIEFSDASRVKEIMEQMKTQFANSNALAGMGVLASFASALATLADEIEKLKRRTSSADN